MNTDKPLTTCLMAVARSCPWDEVQALEGRISVCEDAAIIIADMERLAADDDVLAAALPSGHLSFVGLIQDALAKRLAALVERAHLDRCAVIIGMLTPTVMEAVPMPSQAAAYLAERMRALADEGHVGLMRCLFEAALGVIHDTSEVSKGQHRLLLSVLRDAIWHAASTDGAGKASLTVLWRSVVMACSKRPMDPMRILMELPEPVSSRLIGDKGGLGERIARFAGKEALTTSEAAELLGLSHEYFRQRIPQLPEGVLIEDGRPKRFDCRRLIELALMGLTFPGNSGGGITK